MLCNTISNYPDSIDPMLFFQDNNLENIDIINTYNNLISQGKFTEASDYIDQQDGVYGYFADFFNAIENRIYNLQDYLLTKPPIKKPYVFCDSDDAIEEPEIDEGMFWL